MGAVTRSSLRQHGTDFLAVIPGREPRIVVRGKLRFGTGIHGQHASEI
jgi:hypothetical protein